MIGQMLLYKVYHPVISSIKKLVTHNWKLIVSMHD
jgi:hypothetical protein